MAPVVPAFNKEQKASINAAIKAHADAGKNLTITGYAKAAGIKRDSVKPFVIALGLPVSSVLKPEPAGSPDEGEGGGPTGPTETGGAPPDSELRPEDYTPEVGNVLREIRKMPAAVAGAVTEAINRRLPAPGQDTESRATAAAVQALTESHISDTSAIAGRLDSWDKSTGQAVREFYMASGLAGEFPGDEGPKAMVRAAMSFWWNNRGEITQLRRDYDDALDELDEAHRQLDPENRRREQTDNVWKLLTVAAMGGHPLPKGEVAYLLRVAQALAEGTTLPSETSGPPILEPAGGLVWIPGE